MSEPREAETALNIEHLDWLVRSRSENQRLLLDLLAFAKEHPERAAPHTLFQRLTGAAFSLWRAVFLAEGERRPETIRTDAMKFLEHVVRDNMISYTQDRATQVWTFGYYLNNAYFRLRDAYQKPSYVGPTRYKSAVESFLSMQAEPPYADPGSHAAWDTAHLAAREIFSSLTES